MLGLLFRFGAWLLGGLVAMVPTLMGQALIALGIGTITYTGVSTTLGWLKTFSMSYFAMMPVPVLGLLALMKVGMCISMVASAIAIRLGLNGLSSDTVKRWVKR